MLKNKILYINTQKITIIDDNNLKKHFIKKKIKEIILYEKILLRISPIFNHLSEYFIQNYAIAGMV